ncbi:CorA Metal Ion Transporter (MIT) Family [Thraustotheca clavata]|uniref:CorA Metal Ion Transporter (MIT) Family n=1 Tax=Thraustotheca clavata TaxID=74557 RepID=A0A1V9Z3R0_9STRA|nr:CorA Metal Ion Transporter (MIT) Family [Thraustotheca clavata]
MISIMLDVIRFDEKAVASYEETTLGNLMKLIQSYALLTSPLKDSQPIFNPQSRTEIPPIHMRDLRKLDNVFSTSNEASITLRQQTILVNADPIRAIIMRDTCLVFLPDGADSLISLLKQSFKEYIMDNQPIAYEFGALEAILQTLCKFIGSDCEKLLPKAKIAVDRMARDELPISDLEGFRILKNAMHELNTQAPL